MKMRMYDCTHLSVNNLEKELLFNEVMRLRKMLVDAELLLDKFIEDTEDNTSVKMKAKKFLYEGIHRE